MRTLITTILLAGVAATAVVGDASAQRRRVATTTDYDSASINSIPLTVNRRSWLDSGNAQSTGGQTGPAYVAATTGFAKTQDRIFRPDNFGNAAFPSSPYVPGRNSPLVEFSTTPGGGVIVDNVTHYQPY